MSLQLCDVRLCPRMYVGCVVALAKVLVVVVVVVVVMMVEAVTHYVYKRMNERMSE